MLGIKLYGEKRFKDIEAILKNHNIILSNYVCDNNSQHRALEVEIVDSYVKLSCPDCDFVRIIIPASSK